MNNRVPPLRVWFFSFFLFFVFLLFSFFLPARQDTNYFHLERLLRFQSADSASQITKVVALGSSLTQSAFYFDEKMEDFCKNRGRPDIRFIRITKPTAKMKDFRKFYDALEKVKPDIILIETTMNGFVFQPRINRLQKISGKIRNSYFSLLGSWGLSFFVPRKSHNEVLFDAEEEIRGKIYKRIRKLRRLRYPSNGAQLNPRPFNNEDFTFFEKVRKRGGKIVLLEILRSDVAIAQFDPLVLSGARSINLKLQRDHNFLYWKDNISMNLSHYSDFAHLNSLGRKKYCLWFLEKMDSLKITGLSR